MSTYYVIPARKNSKGFKHKNRVLFQKAADELNELRDNVIITSDDDYIKALNTNYGFKFLKRSDHLSLDNIDIKSVLIDVVDKYSLKKDDDIVLLYLTYPERKSSDISKVLEFYKTHNGSSLLCREELAQHPYLCFYETSSNKGERIVQHELYRRQDYPSCFFGSHFIAIVKVSHLNKVDKNLFSSETIFYDLKSNKLDIDYESDYLNIK